MGKGGRKKKKKCSSRVIRKNGDEKPHNKAGKKIELVRKQFNRKKKALGKKNCTAKRGQGGGQKEMDQKVTSGG